MNIADFCRLILFLCAVNEHHKNFQKNYFNCLLFSKIQIAIAHIFSVLSDERKKEEVSEFLDDNPGFLGEYIDRNPHLLDEYVENNVDEITVRKWLQKVEAPAPGKSTVIYECHVMM